MQRKRGNWHLEDGLLGQVYLVFISHNHGIAALHAPHGGSECGAAGVTEGAVGLDDGLLAHHALAAHVLHVVIGVGG